MSNLIYCRGCGVQIHESATSCPKCGAVQVKLGDASSHQTALSITACVVGVITLLAALGVNKPWSRDEVIGVVFLSLIASVCGVSSLFHQKPSKSTAVIGLVLAGMSLLICVGNL